MIVYPYTSEARRGKETSNQENGENNGEQDMAMASADEGEVPDRQRMGKDVEV